MIIVQVQQDQVSLLLTKVFLRHEYQSQLVWKNIIVQYDLDQYH